MKMQLAALVAALALVTPIMGSAKDHQSQGNGSGNVYAQNQQNQNDQDNDDQGNGNRGSSGSAHQCTNPAGHQRGWCKNQRQNQNGNCNGYNGYPTPNPNNGQNNGNCASNGQNGQNGTVVLRGVITGINGNTVTILRGLVPTSFDDSQAVQNGRVNGSLYPSRSITAQGYYDNNGYFRATTIS